MKRLFIFVFVFLMFVIACSKKEVKRVSEDSIIATDAFALIETIKDAYIKKDLATIEKNSTKEGFRMIRGAIKSFDSAELSFSPVFLEIDKDIVYLNVSWKGVWRKGEQTTEERGMAVFVLKGKPLKVDNIIWANPFRYPEL